jgi:hypothetical protein
MNKGWKEGKKERREKRRYEFKTVDLWGKKYVKGQGKEGCGYDQSFHTHNS